MLFLSDILPTGYMAAENAGIEPGDTVAVWGAGPGTLSVTGVYVGMIDKMPFGSAMNRGITIRTGQTHVQRHTQLLIEKIEVVRSTRRS